MRKKRVVLLILTLLITLASTSCGLDYRYSLDENLQYQVESVWEENNPSYAIYNGKKYVYLEKPIFSIDKSNEDVLISWNGSRYFGYVYEYYSYTSDNPLFLYTFHGSYIHENYDFSEDTFLIGDTNSEIAWENVLDSKQPDFQFSDSCTIYLRSKQCTRIKIRLDLVYDNDQWYISLPRAEGIWTPSDEFLKLLKQTGII